MAGIQFFPEPLRYHITAFRPSGSHLILYLFLVPAFIEAEHTRILAQPALHKALRQPGAQFIFIASLDADRNLNLRILMALALVRRQDPKGKQKQDDQEGGLPHIPFTGQKEPNHHLFHRLPSSTHRLSRKQTAITAASLTNTPGSMTDVTVIFIPSIKI